jgi:enoyl-CoA hydratase/carnithine racemase
VSGVGLELGGGLAVLTLEGESHLNAFDLQMRDALIEALSAARDDPAVRALLLTAAGPNFSAGADLRQFGSAGDPYEARWIRDRRNPWRLLWNLPLPTVAALHGVAVGSGLEMSLLCDVRLCAEGTRLALPEARLGMLPAAGGTQSLPRAIGRSRSLPLVMTGAEIDPAEALRLGVVHGISADLEREARALAERFARLPAMAAAALALRAASETSLEEGLRYERILAAHPSFRLASK